MTLALLYVWEDARVWAPGDHSCNAHVKCLGGFPGGSDVKKKSTSNAGDPDLIAGSGRYPGERNGNLLQYSCRENSMDRGAWQATVHRVTKSQTRLKRLSIQCACMHAQAYVYYSIFTHDETLCFCFLKLRIMHQS